MSARGRRKRDSIRMPRYAEAGGKGRERGDGLSRRELALTLAWQTPAEQRTPDQVALLAGEGWERAAPVQREAPEMERLWRGVKTRWWRPGWRRWEAAAWSEAEARRRAREGVSVGWPDCGLLLPRLPGVIGAPVHAALELKAPEKAPKRAHGENWWLEPLGTAQTRYGLTREQAANLRMLDAMGWRTKVAFGADEALAWLDEIAGPRPSEMPEAWAFWTEGEL